MKYFQLEGIINEELLNKFIDFYNNYLPDNECSVVINSTGGKATVTTLILHMINSNANKFTLISMGSYSAAFDLFYFAKCKRQIVKGSLGCVHKAYIKDVALNIQKQVIYYEDECQLKNHKNSDDSYLRNLLTKSELRRYNKSEDIYFTFKRMTEIFPDVEVIKE